MEKLKNVGIGLLIGGIIALLFNGVVFRFCGIILVSEAFIFLPIMNNLCKMTNKYFSVGRKEALGIGTVLLPLFYAIANGYETTSTIVIILIYWFLMFLFNNKKYDKNVLQDTIDDLSQKLDRIQGDLDIIERDVKSYGVVDRVTIKEKMIIKRPVENAPYYKPPINLLDNNSDNNLKSVLNSIKSNNELNSNKLIFCLGKDKNGENVYLNLREAQNVLITGSVGYGKTTLLNNIILTLLMRNKADEVKIMISEIKSLDLYCYNGLPNLICPVNSEASKGLLSLQKLNILIDERIELLRQSNCKNIEAYNKYVKKKNDSAYKQLPYIVCIIDDLASLMEYRKNDTEDAIDHLSRLGSSVGVHLICVTRNVNKEIVTDSIKRSLQTVISFDLASNTDSKVIFGSTDASKIDKVGELLFRINNSKPIRVKGIYVSDNEINKVVNFIKEKNNYLNYSDNIVFLNNNEKDALYDEILDFAIVNGEISASIIQEFFNIGYTRAARIIDIFEDQGIIGPNRGDKSREVLVKYED